MQKKNILCLSNGATPKRTEKRHNYWSIHTPPKTKNCNFIEFMNWNTFPMREQKQQSFEFETTKKTHRKHHQVLELTCFLIVFILVRT